MAQTLVFNIVDYITGIQLDVDDSDKLNYTKSEVSEILRGISDFSYDLIEPLKLNGREIYNVFYVHPGGIWAKLRHAYVAGDTKTLCGKTINKRWGTYSYIHEYSEVSCPECMAKLDKIKKANIRENNDTRAKS